MVKCGYFYKPYEPHSQVLVPLDYLSYVRVAAREKGSVNPADCGVETDVANASQPAVAPTGMSCGSVEDCTQCDDRALHVLVAVCTNSVGRWVCQH
jgi:hypothetical protein